MTQAVNQTKALMIATVLGVAGVYTGAVFARDLAVAWIIPIAFVLLLWAAAAVRHWPGLGSAALALSLGTMGAGTVGGLAPLLMVLAVVLALAAWQLNHMAWRFDRAGRVEKQGAIMGGVLLRLAVFVGLSMGLAALPLLVELELSFFAGVILALLTVFVLSRVVRMLTQEEDES